MRVPQFKWEGSGTRGTRPCQPRGQPPVGLSAHRAHAAAKSKSGGALPTRPPITRIPDNALCKRVSDGRDRSFSGRRRTAFFAGPSVPPPYPSRALQNFPLRVSAARGTGREGMLQRNTRTRRCQRGSQSHAQGCWFSRRSFFSCPDAGVQLGRERGMQRIVLTPRGFLGSEILAQG